jgi:hypothetical protein
MKRGFVVKNLLFVYHFLCIFTIGKKQYTAKVQLHSKNKQKNTAHQPKLMCRTRFLFYKKLGFLTTTFLRRNNYHHFFTFQFWHLLCSTILFQFF